MLAKVVQRKVALNANRVVAGERGYTGRREAEGRAVKAGRLRIPSVAETAFQRELSGEGNLTRFGI
jgi:hypothetical protein